MGESVCLMHGFSYDSTIPNVPTKQEKHAHTLRESVSFGRFFDESLSYDRWSSFSSHMKYVEEAARFAKPGSVAQKKAFFESHYKAIAARKAAAAVFLQEIDQQNNAKTSIGGDDDRNGDARQIVILNSPFEAGVVEIQDPKEDQNVEIAGNEFCDDHSLNHHNSLENRTKFSEMERPLPKPDPIADEDSSSVASNKSSSLSSLKSSIQQKTWKVQSQSVHPVTPHLKSKEAIISTRKPTVESMDKEGASSKAIGKLTNLIPVKVTEKKLSSAAKGCKTPLRTPSAATKHALSPLSAIKSLRTPPVQPPTRRSRTTGPKWDVLSALCTKSLTACRNKLQSAALSSPFNLRTKERATIMKQKPEDKFYANEMQKAPPQKAPLQKAVKVLHSNGNSKSRKLTCSSFCFKARPLPDFYKDGQIPSNQMKGTPPRQLPPIAGRSIVNKKQGIVSMPPSSSENKTDKPRIDSSPYIVRS